MKTMKALKIILIVSIIILLSIISFGGIFVQNKNIMENILPEYKLSRDLYAHRRVVYKVSDAKETVNYDAEGNKIQSSDTETVVAKSEEVPVNKEEVLTEENYKKAKEIIESRLKTIGAVDYVLRENLQDGTVVLELTENDITDRLIENSSIVGKFEIVDHDTKEVLMTNDDLESVIAGYGTGTSGVTAVFLNIQFNKEGTEKFKNITNTYVKTTTKKETSTENVTGQANENTQETSEPETETVTKQIAIMLDGYELLETYFDREVSNGLLQLTIGATNNTKTVTELQDYFMQANTLAAVLNSGKMPITYTTEQNKLVYSHITANQINIAIAVAIAIFTILMIYTIIKFKIKGILATISLIGYVALLLIGIRYFNVEISVGGIATILFSILISSDILVTTLKLGEISKGIKISSIILVPALIIAIVLTFMNIGIGAVLFWGIAIAILYHLTVTNLLLKD